MKKVISESEWDSINYDVDQYFNGAIKAYLDSNFEPNKSSTSANYPAYKINGTTWLYFSKGKNSDFCMVLNTGDKSGYSPSRFMAEIGLYSGLSSADASVKMQLECYGEEKFKDVFGYLPNEMHKFKKIPKPIIKDVEPGPSDEEKAQQLTKDIQAAANLYAKANTGMGDQFIHERALSLETTLDPRFSNLKNYTFDFMGKDKDDKPRHVYQKFVLVPHYHINAQKKWEVCMVEKICDKKSGGKKLNTPGKKLLWASTNLLEADTLVLTENVIDCMSHSELFGTTNYAYMALAGNPSVAAQNCFKWMLNQVNAQRDTPMNVVAAFDNDEAGAKFDILIKELLPETYQNLDSSYVQGHGKFLVVKPPDGMNDWNDVLKAVKANMTNELENGFKEGELGNEVNEIGMSM